MAKVEITTDPYKALIDKDVMVHVTERMIPFSGELIAEDKDDITLWVELYKKHKIISKRYIVCIEPMYGDTKE